MSASYLHVKHARKVDAPLSSPIYNAFLQVPSDGRSCIIGDSFMYRLWGLCRGRGTMKLSQ